MKKLFIPVMFLFLVAVVMSSCASSRSKYGCPSTQTSGSRFRA